MKLEIDGDLFKVKLQFPMQEADAVFGSGSDDSKVSY